MSVAMRVKHLLDKHGDSLRQAEQRTGVSRETFRRIINGYEGSTLVFHVQTIARGYGVDEKALLEGLDPKGDFEWTVQQAQGSLRLEWLMMSQADRVKLTLDFLRVRYPRAVAPTALAAAAGMSEVRLRTLLERWGWNPPDRREAADLAQAVHHLTGISLAWFTRGRLEEEWPAGSRCITRLSRWLRDPALTKSLVDMISAGWS